MRKTAERRADDHSDGEGPAARDRQPGLIAAVAVLVVPALIYTAVIGWRLERKADVESRQNYPVQIEQALGEDRTIGDDGSITASAEFTSVFAKDEDYVASEDFTWNDQWFFADATAYNHELAQACAALTSVANAESEYFMLVGDTTDYMVELLSRLGFEYALTNTYEYRSAILDQLAEAIKPSPGDTTAYTIASKHITDETSGKKKLLLIAIVRGTYGPEWFSNFKAGVAESKATESGDDHAGFSVAAQGLLDDVYDFLDELRRSNPDDADIDVSLLLVGQSRGGALANLAAATYDDYFAGEERGEDSDVEGTNVDAVYAYTFASPGSTRNAPSRDARYDNIFNICNPADLIPQTPLASWGYTRYGRDLWLPEEDSSADFDALWEDVRARLRTIEGCDTSADPSDAEAVRQIVQAVGEAVPTIEDFATPSGLLSAFQAVLGSGADLGRILQSHSPELYFSWLQAIDASQLAAKN